MSDPTEQAAMDDIDHERARRTAENIVAVHIDGDCSKGCNLARAYLAAMAEIDRLRAEREWRPIDEGAKSGEPVLIARHMPIWGWVRGWGQWVDVRGIAGFISHGFYEPPGVLGLAHPTHYSPIPTPPAAGKGETDGE